MIPYINALNHTNIVELQRTINSGRCVLVAGSGLSIMAATDEGKHPPNWVGLLEKMTDWCLKEGIIDQEIFDGIMAFIQDGELDDAGKEIEDYLRRYGKQGKCLRETLLCDQAKISEMHRAIVDLPFRAYLTTNYDTFIENAYFTVKEKRLAKFYESSIQDVIAEYWEYESQPYILKLHGDIELPDSIIIGDRGFDRFLHRSNSYWRNLEKLLAMSSILFMGFGKRDHDLEGILNKIGVFGKLNKHWMIIPEGHLSKLKAKHLRDDKGIRLIEYTDNYNGAGDSNQNEGLLGLLKRLTEPTVPIRLSSDEGTRTGVIAMVSNIGQEIPKREREYGGNLLHVTDTLLERSLEIFYVYAPSEEDENLREKFERKVLNSLKSRKFISGWYARDIWARQDQQIKSRFEAARIVLLLVSSDFVASDYCDGSEFQIAMKRHEAKEICMIPILLRAVDYEGAAFDQLDVIPSDKQAINNWEDEDKAFTDVSKGIRKMIAEFKFNDYNTNKQGYSTPTFLQGDIDMTIEQDAIKIADFLRTLRKQIIEHPEFENIYGDEGNINTQVEDLAVALTTNFQSLNEARKKAARYPSNILYQNTVQMQMEGLAATNIQVEELWQKFRNKTLIKTESLIIQVEQEAPKQIEQDKIEEAKQDDTNGNEASNDAESLAQQSWMSKTLAGLNTFKNFLVTANDVKKAIGEWSPGLVEHVRSTLDQVGQFVGQIRL